MKKLQPSDYAATFRSRSREASVESVAENDWSRGTVARAEAIHECEPAASANDIKHTSTNTFLKRCHAFSYVGLFLFTLILYARPGEFYPSPITASIALIV